MAWLRFREAEANSRKVTAEQDLDWGYLLNCHSLDYCRDNTSLARVMVKKFEKHYNPVVNPDYLYLKSFKWDDVKHAYVRNSQVSLSLHEFKMLREQLGSIDDMIDRVIVAGGPPPTPLVFRAKRLLQEAEREVASDIHRNDAEMSSAADDDDVTPPPTKTCKL